MSDTSSHECFNVTIDENIAHIQLSRPDKFNSMIPAFWTELPKIVEDISDNAKARVIVISSQGRHFCSGMDLAVFTGPGDEEKPDPRTTQQRNEAIRLNVRDLQRTISCLDDARMPVLMAIQGGCIGGGVDGGVQYVHYVRGGHGAGAGGGHGARRRAAGGHR